jgi:AhpD family alkylhydroperoxidase
VHEGQLLGAKGAGVMRALLGSSRYLLEQSSVDERLLSLMQLRVSQINSCGFCCVLHANEARDAPESPQYRISHAAAERELPHQADANTSVTIDDDVIAYRSRLFGLA